MAELTLPEPTVNPKSRDRRASSVSRTTGRWTRNLWHPSLLPLAAFLVIALPGRWLVAGDPESQDLIGRLAPPVFLDGTWDRPLGTDGLGRDILSRIVSGALLSLAIGVSAAIFSAAIGISLGLLAGMLGGLVDATATLVSELALAIPTVVVGIVLTATLGQSLPNLLAILVFTGWISYARIVRLQCRQIARSEYVRASYAIGARWPWVMLKHVLPNIRSIAIVLLFQQIAAVMLWEASLTYLGLGLPIERISLGGMIRDGQVQIFDAWWVSFFPGFVIALAVVGFNLAADRMQSVFDPATR